MGSFGILEIILEGGMSYYEAMTKVGQVTFICILDGQKASFGIDLTQTATTKSDRMEFDFTCLCCKVERGPQAPKRIIL